MPLKCTKIGRLSGALALSLASSTVATPTYVFNSTANSDVPGLTGFSTTGAMMDGMTVRVEFGTGGFQVAHLG
ncbi:MAG: hypothetical protein IPJ42_09165 [Betaproteobacteria bacterium]|nr:hypothetical protein [Betaproteobacteria bacterium]